MLILALEIAAIAVLHAAKLNDNAKPASQSASVSINQRTAFPANHSFRIQN